MACTVQVALCLPLRPTTQTWKLLFIPQGQAVETRDQPQRVISANRKLQKLMPVLRCQSLPQPDGPPRVMNGALSTDALLA